VLQSIGGTGGSRGGWWVPRGRGGGGGGGGRWPVGNVAATCSMAFEANFVSITIAWHATNCTRPERESSREAFQRTFLCVHLTALGCLGKHVWFEQR